MLSHQNPLWQSIRVLASPNVLGPILQLSWLLARLNTQLQTAIVLSGATQEEVSEHFVTRGVDVLAFYGPGGEYGQSPANRGVGRGSLGEGRGQVFGGQLC